jgi:histidine triad (HIT) family protein
MDMAANVPADPVCAFCRIARDEESAEVVCQGGDWLAFFPLTPATPGHTLVIPRAHVADLWQADPGLGRELMSAVITVGRAIEAALQPDGMNLITSAGTAAEQTVFHLHLHLVPRWRDDGFGQIWSTGNRFEGISLDGLADRIRQACETDQSMA